MARGLPDKTGRSSGRYAGRAGERLGPPEGEPWIWFTRKMLESPAMRGLGINARRVLDFLCIEDMSHAGRMNGQLLAPYHQLVRFGVPRSEIAGAIRQLEAFGLIRVTRRGRLDGKSGASQYALTSRPVENEFPTNEWRRVKIQQVEAFLKERRADNAHRKLRRRERMSSTAKLSLVVDG